MRQLFPRALSGFVTIWVAATLAFFTLSILPGDAIESQLTQSGVDLDLIEERRAELGLTDSIPVQYLRFMTNALRGRLGYSLLSGETVIEVIARNIPPTFTLAFVALIVASTSGIMLGVISAWQRGPLAGIAKLITNLGLSTPIYWTGTIAIYIFTVQFGLLPSAGAGRLSQLILPVAVLSFHTAATIARITHSNVLDAMHASHVRTARAKGLPEHRVVQAHVLRVALLPVVGVIALQAGFLLNGTVITESLFVRPGIGRLLLESTIQQDYPVVLGIVILAAFVYTAVNFVADVVAHILDPRVTF